MNSIQTLVLQFNAGIAALFFSDMQLFTSFCLWHLVLAPGFTLVFFSISLVRIMFAVLWDIFELVRVPPEVGTRAPGLWCGNLWAASSRRLSL